MNRIPDFGERLNLFLYQRNVGRLESPDIETAREWCLEFIRKEHPKWSAKQVDEYYESLVDVELHAVDEWKRRNGLA